MTATADHRAAPAGNRFGRSFALALAGGALGCAAVLAVSAVLGAWVLFLAFPPFAVFLILSALVAALLTAALARLWPRRLAASAVLAISAALTFVLFSTLPLYFVMFVPSRAAGLLFG